MAKTLVTGASGFLGSHLVRALAERGDELRLLARRSSNLDHLDELEFERATGDVTDRRAVRRAMEGVERVFHVAGRTSLRAADREAVFAANLRGARIVFEEALEQGSSGSSTPRPSGRSGSRSRRAPPTRRPRSRSATSASPTSTPSTRPSSRRSGSPPTASRW